MCLPSVRAITEGVSRHGPFISILYFQLQLEISFVVTKPTFPEQYSLSILIKLKRPHLNICVQSGLCASISSQKSEMSPRLTQTEMKLNEDGQELGSRSRHCFFHSSVNVVRHVLLW